MIKKFLSFAFFSILFTPFFIILLVAIIAACAAAIPFSPIILYFALIENASEKKSVETKRNEILEKVRDRKRMSSG